MMMNVLRRVVFFVALMFAVPVSLGVATTACEHIEPQHIVTPAVRASCILIRAFVSSGSMQEVCATADELAPLVEQIIADREETSPQEQRASAASVAFSLPAPPKRVPRRRCVQWHVLGDDSGTGDESSALRDAASSNDGQRSRDASDDGGERRDGGRERGDGGSPHAR